MLTFYKLNRQTLKIEDIIDDYDQAIYTIRFQSYGEFRITCVPGSNTDKRLGRGSVLFMPISDRPMIVDTRQKSKNADGKEILQIEGRDYLSLLMYRGIGPNFTSQLPAAQVATGLVNSHLVLGDGHGGNRDIYPFLTVQDWSGTTETTDFEAGPDTMYNVVQGLVKSVGRGMGMFKIGGSKPIAFRVYNGQDRPNLFFSDKLENIAETSWINSHRDTYNAAQTYGSDGYFDTFPNASPPSGMSRRVLIVSATDISPDDHASYERYKAALHQRSKEELKKVRHKILVDGNLTKDGMFKYGTDFLLGDRMWVGYDNQKTKMYVDEYIWTSDGEGDLEYPTFRPVTDLDD